MHLLVYLFACLISSSIFSCTPPQRESSLSGSPVIVALATVTQSTSKNSRTYNCILEDLEELTCDSYRSKLQDDKTRAEQESALEDIYFEWPGRSAPIQIIPKNAPQASWQNRHNESNCP